MFPRFTLVLTGLLAVCDILDGAALPSLNNLAPRSCAQEVTMIQQSNSPAAQFLNNGSYLLGWQLSGIFGAVNLTQNLCNDFDTLDNKWTQEGLNTAAIKAPICERLGCDATQDGYNIYMHIIAFVRGLFNVEILNALTNNQNTWLTLCNTLNSVRLGTFLGADTTIGITCKLAGETSPPNPSVGDNTVPQSAVDAIHNAASNLLGWEILGLFTTNKQVSFFCNLYPQYSANVATIDLDPTIVQNIVCQYQTQNLPSVSTIQQQFGTYYATIFATTLLAVSDSMAYQKFICKGYKDGSLANFNAQITGLQVVGPLVTSMVIDQCKAAGVDA